MNTITYYLDQLDYYRRLLIANLRELGIVCDDDEKYNTLIPKIYSLKNSGGVLLPDFTLRSYQGSSENIDIILDRIIPLNQITSLADKFRDCINLTNLPLYKWDTSKITNMRYMIMGVTGPVVLDAHGCDLSSVTVSTSVSTDSSYAAATNLGTLILNNTKLSVPAFISLTSFQKSINTVEGWDTVDIVVPEEGEVSITGILRYFYSNLDLSNLFNKLEDRDVYAGGDTFYSAANMTYPIILPKCNIRIGLSSSSGMYMREMHSTKHIDLSNATISNAANLNNCNFIMNFNGNHLTDEELEGAVFKLYANYKDIRYSGFNISHNKLCQDLDLTGLKLKTWDSLSALGSYIKTIDYTTFDVSTYPTSSTTIFNYGNSTFNYNTYLKLETFKYNLGGNIYFSSSDRYFSSCPNLKHVEFTNCYVSTFSNAFRSSSSNTNATKNIEYLSLEGCTFKSGVNHFSGVSNQKNLKELNLKNTVYESNTIHSMFLYYLEYVEKIDMSGADWGNITTFGSNIFPVNYGTSVTNTHIKTLLIPNNIGKAFSNTTANYSNYTIQFSGMSELTRDSVLDIVNKVYDLNISYNVYDEEGNPGTGVLYTQQLILGEINLAKLTPEEIAIATNKGWTVS